METVGALIVCLLVGCLTSQQQASVSQGRICSDKFTCCHTEIEVADQTFYLTQSQYTNTGPTSPSADPITQGVWQGNHRSANFSYWYDSTRKKSCRKRDSNPGSSALKAIEVVDSWCTVQQCSSPTTPGSVKGFMIVIMISKWSQASKRAPTAALLWYLIATLIKYFDGSALLELPNDDNHYFTDCG